MEISRKNVPNHVNWHTMAFGLGSTMSSSEANEIIEEIIAVLIARKLTVKAAKDLLEETISSIDKEFVLEKRKIGDEII